MASSPDLPSESSDQGVTLPSPAEACRLAVNLATRRGYAVFPVQADKRPRVKDWPNLASKDAAAIRDLWRRFPDPLVGIATGSASGVWVLDIDVKHQTAIDWWHDNHHRLLPTLVYRTRSGGLHCYYRDGGAQGNSASRPVKGVDVRGTGGYVVSWFCAGLECLEHGEVAPWPDWLARRLARQPVVARGPYRRPDTSSNWLRGVLDTLEGAPEGERNALLFWCACRLVERGLKQQEVERLLLPAAVERGLSDLEARRTIASASRR